VSFRSEVDTAPFIEQAWSQGITVLVPRCIPSTREMELYQFTGWDELQPGAYGIMEPSPGKARLWTEGVLPGAVLVPGLAFDRQGGRLGYGGGYYDRYYERTLHCHIADGQELPYWLGLSFESQIVQGGIPSERHDIRLDGVFTERAIYLEIQ
jgi:5-formyltetrahydrofolate cyclo-ligase